MGLLTSPDPCGFGVLCPNAVFEDKKTYENAISALQTAPNLNELGVRPVGLP